MRLPLLLLTSFSLPLSMAGDQKDSQGLILPEEYDLDFGSDDIEIGIWPEGLILQIEKDFFESSCECGPECGCNCCPKLKIPIDN